MSQHEDKKTEPVKTQDTPDINIATFIKEVKGKDTQGHYYKGSQLWVKFAITDEEMKRFKEDYINSIFSRYDATKRNLLRLLKR